MIYFWIWWIVRFVVYVVSAVHLLPAVFKQDWVPAIFWLILCIVTTPKVTFQFKKPKELVPPTSSRDVVSKSYVDRLNKS